MKLTPAGEISDLVKDAYHNTKKSMEEKTPFGDISYEGLHITMRMSGLVVRFMSLGFMTGIALEYAGVLAPGTVSGQSQTYNQIGETISGELGAGLCYSAGCVLSYVVNKESERYKDTVSLIAKEVTEGVRMIKKDFNYLVSKIRKPKA